MLAIAVVVCTLFLIRDARRQGLASSVVLDLAFWTVLSGIVGARIFFVLLNIDFFIHYPLEIIMLQHGGLAWQGGLIGGTLAAVLFIWKTKLPFGKIADLAAPYVALGQAIGRIGCFLNGCCYGKEVSWGIYFEVHAAHLHPTQLYASLGLLAIFFILKKYQPYARPSGRVFFLYLILASTQRFIVEFFRADHEIFWMGLSIFQVVSLIVLIGALYGNLYLKSRSGK
jgi:phosphatidylglycerol:prolipoprotein diacylglycerol transferase